MEIAAKKANWDSFNDRRKKSLQNGKLRGIGLSTYIEACSGGGPEEATIILENTGEVTVHIGSQSNGQGHETAFTQIICEFLDVNPEKVKISVSVP